MAETGSSTRRQLKFTVSQPEVCTLCHQQHTQLSSPSSWKNRVCQELAQSLRVPAHSPVCRPCRYDITRLAEDPTHHPRWEKERENKCAVPKCKNTFFCKRSIPVSDFRKYLVNKDENIPSTAEEHVYTTPLCKHHYHLVYNMSHPKQLHCPTCGTLLKMQNARSCPDPDAIQAYLSDKTGFDGVLCKGAKTCYACYKFHLQILNQSKCLSTDEDLMKILHVSIRNTLQMTEINDLDGVISRAVSMITVDVAEALLRQEGLLLPDVYNSFLAYISECMMSDHFWVWRLIIENLLKASVN